MINWSLLRKKIDGKLSDAEMQIFKDWVDERPERQKFMERAEKFYAKDEMPVVEQQQEDKAWMRFIEFRKTKTIYKQLRRWGNIAAAVILFAGAWLLLRQEPVEPVVQEASSAFEPGEVKAVLRTSRGEVLKLGKNDQRQIRDRQAVIKMDSAGITYEIVVAVEKVISIDENLHDTINTYHGGEYMLRLSDGTRVWLNAETELIYPVAFAGGERRVKLSGEAYFEVTKDERNPFIVETEGVDIKVLGTSFNVCAYDDDEVVRTTLSTGKVQLQKKNKKICVLNPDQQAVVNKKSGEFEVMDIQSSFYTRWHEGYFIFRGNTLKEIMKTLSRWYEMSYEFAAEELDQEKFYGIVSRYGEMKELLRAFESTGKVRFEYQDNKVVIKR